MAESQKETTAVVQQEKATAIQTHEGGRGLNLSSLEDMFRFAKYVAASGLAPKGMEKPETILLTLEMGAEVGLAPMQSIQNIAVVNGRPTIWGDAVPGLVHASGKQEYYTQKKIGTPNTDSYGYEVTSKRRGNPEPIVTTFTVADAKKAGLWGKGGPWTFYPDRMLLNRARAFNARDNFPDVLKGMYTTEEIQDASFEVLDSRPLEDGDKTSALADKVAGMAAPAQKEPPVETTAEVVDESTGEILDEPQDSPPPTPEAPRRGRPPKQQDKPETAKSPPADANYVKELKKVLESREQGEFVAARKALGIPTGRMGLL